jgi:hypothetical protein
MRKVMAVVLVAFAVALFSGCGFDLEKFAAEQQALKLQAQTSRIILEGKIIEPLYEVVVGTEFGKNGTSYVTLNKTKIYPENWASAEGAQKYAADLKAEIEKGTLIVIYKVSDFKYQIKPLSKLDEVKAILASTKTEKAKIMELTGLGFGVEADAKKMIDLNK